MRFPWTFVQIEICSVANGATKKEIGRAKEYIVKQLELEMGQSVEMGTIHAGDFMVSFFVSLIYAYYVFVLSKVPNVYSTFFWLSLVFYFHESESSEAFLFQSWYDQSDG